MRSDGLYRRLIRSAFAQHVGSSLLSQVAVLALSMSTAAITARWLGPAGKGQLGLLMLVPSMFQLLLNVGMGAANVYYAGSCRLRVSELASNSAAFAAIGTGAGLLVFLVVLATGSWGRVIPGAPVGYLWVAMAALPLGLLSANLRGILQGLGRIHALNVIVVVQAVFVLPLTGVLVVWLRLGVLGALLASLAMQPVMVFVTARCLHDQGASLRPRWNSEVVARLLAYGAKNYVGDLLQFFNYRLDTFIVNYFLGPAGVGIYGVSVVLAELLWQLPNAAGFVIFPKAASSTSETMNRFTPRVFSILMVTTMLGAIGLAVFGKAAIRLVFSAAFLDAYVPLLVLLPGVALLGSAKVLTNDIAGRGFPQYNSITSGTSLVATIVLDLTLIPRMGVVGAALASTLSYVLIFALAVFFYVRVSRIPTRHDPGSIGTLSRDRPAFDVRPDDG